MQGDGQGGGHRQGPPTQLLLEQVQVHAATEGALCDEEPGYVQQGHLDDPDEDQPILNISLLSIQTDFIMKVNIC